MLNVLCWLTWSMQFIIIFIEYITCSYQNNSPNNFAKYLAMELLWQIILPSTSNSGLTLNGVAKGTIGYL